jgi:2'-5' RNA ligase
VATWRDRFDPPAILGMPAHVTVLYPFVPAEGLSERVIGRLTAMCAEQPALDVMFTRLARFPDALYLEPEPADEIRHLTLKVAELWPESPPYGGAFDEVIPHLTIAVGVGEPAFAEVEAALAEWLPIQARLAEAVLYAFDGARWQVRARMPFA